MVETELTKSWLKTLGFRFDPFKYLEASSDPYLGDYIIGHQTFSIAWEEAPAIIMAPPGGGKTTMRIYATRSCWVGRGGAHPFPVPYYLPLYFDNSHPPSLAAHCEMLMRASAHSLLIGLAHRPESFLHLPLAIQQKTAAILDEALQGLLPRYISILKQTGEPRQLSQLLDRTYTLADLPLNDIMLSFCVTLENALSKIEQAISGEPIDRFKRMANLITGDLGYRCLFVLADGVDAFVKSGRDPKIAIGLVETLFERADVWAKLGIYLKGFLPIDTESIIYDQLGDAALVFRISKILWTSDLLAEIVRKRVHAASGGQFGSLDAISSPALRDIETNLANEVEPLPREIVRMVQLVLEAYKNRNAGGIGQIEPEDINNAINQYHKEHQIIMPHLISREA